MLLARPLTSLDSKASTQYMADFLFPSSDGGGGVGELPDGTTRRYNRIRARNLVLNNDGSGTIITLDGTSGSSQIIFTRTAGNQWDILRPTGSDELRFRVGFTTAWFFNGNGHLLATDNTHDVGAPGATRPRDGFFSRNLTIGGALNHDGTTLGVYGTTPITQQTGVAISSAGIHAACVALGLFTA